MEDTEIIDLYLQRDENAIGETAKKYGGRLRSLSRNMTGNQQDAEECVNDTLLVTWNHIPPEIPKHLPAYLFKITRNLSLDIIAKHSAKKRSAFMQQLLSELDECAVADIHTIESEIDRSELAKRITRFLYTQSELERDLFLCRYFHGNRISEIAFEVQMSENRVTTRLFRTREKLRKVLEQEGYL